MKETLLIQIVMAMMMLVLCLVVGVAPIYLKPLQNPHIASLGNCFSAGVFLSVAMIHLLPDGSDHIEQVIGDRVPLAYILAMVGYTLILMLEKVLFSHHYHEDIQHSMQPAQGENEVATEEATVRAAISTSERLSRRLSYMSQHEAEERIDKLLINHKAHQDSEKFYRKKKIMTALLLVVALAVHSLFEGIAIGLQNSVRKTLNIGLAVCIHKLPAALALGINVKVMQPREALMTIAGFTVASPIGIFIGVGLKHLDVPILIGIFLCFCAGTFLYISTSELISEEFALPKSKWSKFLLLMVGFALFTSLSEALQE